MQLKRFFLFIFALFLIGVPIRAQESTAHLLAFSLLQPLGKNADYYTEVVYIYDMEQDKLHMIGLGDSVRWSPSGRYLAMADTLNDVLSTEKYFGRMKSFSIFDFQTGVIRNQDYEYGEYLDWSPDETYLVAAGSVSGSSGANAWVNILNADGSGEAPVTGPGYADGMSGMRGGIGALGWIWNGDRVQLLIRDIGFQRDGYALVDPTNGERTPVSGDLPVYRPIEWGWGEVGIAQSSDHRYAAVTRVVGLPTNQITYLLIVDMNSGETHPVKLPQSPGAIINQMAWRPCLFQGCI